MRINDTHWSISQLIRYVDVGIATFDNPIQRGVVWDIYRKSLLIHSILCGYPIPALYFTHTYGSVENDEDAEHKKVPTDLYDSFDGKQRSLAIYEYVKNKYKLANHRDLVPVISDTGDKTDVRGLYYSELPKWTQIKLESYVLTVHYFDDMSEHEIREYFRRLNNGKALTSIELTRVQTPNLAKFQQIAQHKAINFVTTNAAKRGFADENIAMQIYNLATEPTPDFSTTAFRSWAKDIDPTDDEIIEIMYSLDLMDELMASCEDKQLLRTIKKRTHFVSATYACYFGIKNKVQKEHLFKRLGQFFVSPTEEYVKTTGSGSAKATNVVTRREIMQELVQGNYDETMFLSDVLKNTSEESDVPDRDTNETDETVSAEESPQSTSLTEELFKRHYNI